jgi:uroporphyrinogen decarboxylase
MAIDTFAAEVKPDWRGLVDCIARRGTPARAHFMELFLDGEIQEAIVKRFGLREGLDPDDPYVGCKLQIRLQRFLGYDYVTAGIERAGLTFHNTVVEDTADLARQGGRCYRDETRGPITTWEELEAYPWPDPTAITTNALEWYQDNLPEDMCLVSNVGAHFAEFLCWLMGYETLCYALYDNRELVEALYKRILELCTTATEAVLKFERVQLVWGSDDMGFKTGPLIGPDDLRALVLPGHRKAVEMTHAAGRMYLLHACGNLSTIMEDLIEDVKIDAKHSFEDTIESVVDLKAQYGDRLTLLGGIDVDFLCRADEAVIRKRVRETLDACTPGGGYCLGSGNSVANYVPLDNYLAMIDEGRKWRK